MRYQNEFILVIPPDCLLESVTKPSAPISCFITYTTTMPGVFYINNVKIDPSFFIILDPSKFYRECYLSSKGNQEYFWQEFDNMINHENLKRYGFSQTIRKSCPGIVLNKEQRLVIDVEENEYCIISNNSLHVFEQGPIRKMSDLIDLYKKFSGQELTKKSF